MTRRLRELVQLACLIVASSQGDVAQAADVPALPGTEHKVAENGPTMLPGEHVSAYAHRLLRSGYKILSTTHRVEVDGRVFEVQLAVAANARVSKVRVMPEPIEAGEADTSSLRPPSAPSNLLLERN